MVCTSPEMPRTRFVTLEGQSWLETIVKDVPTSSSLTQKKKQDHNPIRFGSWQYINSYNLCRFQRCSMLSWVYYTVLEKFGKLVTVDLYQIVIHWNLYITTLYYATMTKQSLVFKDSLLLSYKCYVWYLIKSAATLYLSTCCFCHFLSIFFLHLADVTIILWAMTEVHVFFAVTYKL